MKNIIEACRSCKALKKVIVDMKNLYYDRTWPGKENCNLHRFRRNTKKKQLNSKLQMA